jgi:hypothetical protein
MIKPEHLVKKIKGSFGHIEIFLIDESNYIAVPRGYISIAMIKEDYQFLKNIQSPKVTYGVWFHYFIVPNPINIFFLRKIIRFPHIDRYSIICSLYVVRALFNAIRPLLKFTHVMSAHDYQKMILLNSPVKEIET